MSIEEREGFYRKPGNGLMVELEFFGTMDMTQVAFIADMIRKYRINKTTLTKDGHVRLWNLTEEALDGLLMDAKEAGISCVGAYLKQAVKVYCPALSGMTEGEAFDVRPYADKTREFLGNRAAEGCGQSIQRFYFAGQESDLADASDCAMVFVAQPDNTFRVLVQDENGEFFTLAQNTEAGRFLSYVQVAVQLYNTGLTRENYSGAFWKAMGELDDAIRAHVDVLHTEIKKTGNGNFTCGPRILKQSQEELYAVDCYHFGGVVPIAFWKKLGKAVEDYEDIVLRIDRHLHLYICNLLAEEVHKPLDMMNDAAFTTVERSESGDRCSICPAGVLDPQAFVSILLKELRQLRFRDGVLPTFTVSGCERCCYTVPREELIFVTQTDTPEGRKPGRYCKVRLHMDGDKEFGFMPQQNMAEYLMSIGALVQSAGMDFKSWYVKNTEIFEKLTELNCQDKEELQEQTETEMKKEQKEQDKTEEEA